MMYEFKLPDLGEGIHEGEVLKWHVQPGDTIAEDAPLVDVETDKAAVTIPSPRGGRVVSVAGKPGAIVKVGQVLAVIDEAGGTGVAEGKPGTDTGFPAGNPVSVPGFPRPVPAAPATRRLAREHGVDLASVVPTGPAGRVTREDVLRTAQGASSAVASTAVAPAIPASPPIPYEDPEPGAPEPSPHAAGAGLPLLDLSPLPDFSAFGPVEREPLRSIRRKTARRMMTSMTLIPHVAHMEDIDVTDLDAFRRRLKQEGGGSVPTLLAFVARAVAVSLKSYPAFNASLDPFGEEVFYKRYYNLGIAVDTPRGLVVPVVRDVDRRGLGDVARAIEDAAGRARAGTLQTSDFQGGTFTITNIGALGGTGFFPAINYPESAILGMGRVADKPVVRDGAIVVRRILPVVLAFDHRIADGADAARFVNAVKRLLEDPMRMLIES